MMPRRPEPSPRDAGHPLAAAARALAVMAMAVALLFANGPRAWGQAAPAPDEARAFDAARTAFQDGNYPVARQFFSEFVRQFPQSERTPEAVLFQARAALEQGNTADCIGLLEARLANSGKVTDEYRYWLGEAQYRKGNGAAAAEQFALMLKNHPNSARRLEAAFGEARARFKLREWARVVDLLRNPAGSFRDAAKGRANDERVVSGDLMLAESLLELGDRKAGEEVLRSMQGRTLTPEMRWRHDQLRCRLLFEDGRYAEALAQSTNAVASAAATGITSAPAESIALRASILARLNRLDEAAQAYEKNLTPGTPGPRQREALLRLIQLHLTAGSFNAATQKLELLMSQSPEGTNSDIALLTYGEIHLRSYLQAVKAATNSAASAASTNLLTESIRRLDHLIRAQPNSPLVGLAHLDRGWALEALGRLGEGVEAFRSAAAVLPLSEEQAVAQFKMAELQFRLGELTNALAAFRQFTNRFVTLPRVQSQILDQALMHLVRISFELKDTAAATDAVQQLLAWRPQSEYVEPGLLLMGDRLSLMDRPEQARAWLSRVPETSPQKHLAELMVARTYAQEGLSTNALRHYGLWLERFTNSDLRPRVEYELARTTYQAGDGTNAFQLFTNFLSLHPTHALAPQAMYWVGDYYFREGNYTNAQIQFQKLYENTNWPVTELTYQARMQAGRAAFARQGYNDALPLFSQIVNDPPPYPDLVAKAYFALGDCLMMQASLSTNAITEYAKAATAFQRITKLYGTNEIAPKAWGNLGNCYLQLARADAADYSKATNAYHRALSYPSATVTDRSQAWVGLGLALIRLADSYSNPREQQALLEQAQAHFGRVLYERDLTAGEKPDRFWQKKAGLESIQLAETLQDWNAAVGLCERVKQLLPPLAAEMDRRIARIRTSHPSH